jgi:hypothetical protein
VPKYFQVKRLVLPGRIPGWSLLGRGKSQQQSDASPVKFTMKIVKIALCRHLPGLLHRYRSAKIY